MAGGDERWLATDRMAILLISPVLPLRLPEYNEIRLSLGSLGRGVKGEPHTTLEVEGEGTRP